MSFGFPKGVRLTKSKHFQLEKPHKFRAESFRIVYQFAETPKLGLSISKKSLKNSIARNRVKRLIRENFRKMKDELPPAHMHFISLPGLEAQWKMLKEKNIQAIFHRWKEQCLKNSVK